VAGLIGTPQYRGAAPARPSSSPETDARGAHRGLRGRPRRWLCRKPQGERRVDLQVAQQEGALVEPPAPQPAGDFLVALAGVAGAAGRRDVVERIAAAARDCQHAVALERHADRAAVGAATPSLLERDPLFGAQVMLDPLYPAPAPAGVPGPAGSVDRHGSRVRWTPTRCLTPESFQRGHRPALGSNGSGHRPRHTLASGA
jgi:hypothetical protein